MATDPLDWRALQFLTRQKIQTDKFADGLDQKAGAPGSIGNLGLRAVFCR
jgi:hypothetical protein